MSDLEDLAAIVRSRGETRRAVRPSRSSARFGAAFADFIAVMLLSFVLGLLLAFIAQIFPRLGYQMIGPALVWCLLMLYSAIEIFMSDSPGKWMVGITIALPDGRRAPRRRLLWRWLVKYAFLIVWGMSLFSSWIFLMTWETGSANQARFELFAQVQFILSWAFVVVFSITALGTLGIFFPQRRALHDWIAGTTVFDQLDLVRKPPVSPRAFEVQAQAHVDPASADPDQPSR
jgi:uncharacterized RDD family membrane protein YckC